MESTLTPIVAQSSVELSLITTLTCPFCAWGGVGAGELELPDEHPIEESRNVAEATASISRE
jgi:hypothetical protein